MKSSEPLGLERNASGRPRANDVLYGSKPKKKKVYTESPERITHVQLCTSVDRSRSGILFMTVFAKPLMFVGVSRLNSGPSYGDEIGSLWIPTISYRIARSRVQSMQRGRGGVDQVVVVVAVVREVTHEGL